MSVADKFGTFCLPIILLLPLLSKTAPLAAQVGSSSANTWAVTIVLPRKIVAGQPATLAVLSVDGRLAAGVNVEVSSGTETPQHIVTDPTGRAYFNAPSSGTVLFAKATGGSAATLIDPIARGKNVFAITSDPVVSVHDRFSICGSGLRGDADAIIARLNHEPSLVIAASPECIVVVPSTKLQPGPATILVEASGHQLSCATTLVSLDFENPKSALIPGKKSQILVHVRGSSEPLRIALDNETPGVLTFTHGDTEEVTSTGGAQNDALVPVEVIRSGDYSFHARLLNASAPDAARRYLQAARTLAPDGLQHNIVNLADRLARHPRDSGEVRGRIEQLLAITVAGNFRTLLDAAYSAL